MIVVTRLNDSRFAINPDLIQRILQTPDTTLVMVDGAKYIVTEPMEEVIESIVAFRARVLAAARDLPQTVAASRDRGHIRAIDEVASGTQAAAPGEPADAGPGAG